MNKLIWLTIAILAWFFGSGYFAFSESGVNNFLNHWADSTLQGDADAVCATASKDMTFEINDGTTGRHMQIEGNRDDFCEYVRKTTPLMAKMAGSVHVTRDEMTIEHKALHWWTAQVTYVEHWTINVGGRVTIETVSEDRVTLVKTFKGVFVKRLDSESYVENATQNGST